MVDGLRADDGPDPDFGAFVDEHVGYRQALEAAGVRVEEMAPLDAFPDAVFVEDAALCLGSHAIVLRPGAPSRFGEAEAITADLEARFAAVARVDDGFVDGGDILVTDREVLVGLSARTNAAGAGALAAAVAPTGRPVRVVTTPPGVLHFKNRLCGHRCRRDLLDGPVGGQRLFRRLRRARVPIRGGGSSQHDQGQRSCADAYGLPEGPKHYFETAATT